MVFRTLIAETWRNVPHYVLIINYEKFCYKFGAHWLEISEEKKALSVFIGQTTPGYWQQGSRWGQGANTIPTYTWWSICQRAKAVRVSLLPPVETTLHKTRERKKEHGKEQPEFWACWAGKMESWKGVFLLPINTRMSMEKGWRELLKIHNKSATNPGPWNNLTMNKFV